MVNRHAPPTRKSKAWVVRVNPCGPHQFARCVGSDHAANTSSRGASNTRDRTSSRSAVSARSGVAVIGLLLLGLEFVQVVGEPVEALGPEAFVGLDPVVDRLEP